MAAFETTLATIPASNPKERLELVLCGHGGLELRQQSWGEGVGWFTQSTTQIEASQLNALRAALGQGKATALPKTTRAKSNASWTPKLVLADIA